MISLRRPPSVISLVVVVVVAVIDPGIYSNVVFVIFLFAIVLFVSLSSSLLLLCHFLLFLYLSSKSTLCCFLLAFVSFLLLLHRPILFFSVAFSILAHYSRSRFNHVQYNVDRSVFKELLTFASSVYTYREWRTTCVVRPNVGLTRASFIFRFHLKRKKLHFFYFD